MSTTESIDVPFLQHVFHPSDFSQASETAFAHALTAALVAKAALTILHVSPERDTEWMEFPGVRSTLERWGLLPPNSLRSDVAKLGIDVKKIKAVHTDPVESITNYLAAHATDLVVLATDQSKGGIPWLSKSTAIPIAQASRQMTLFVPKGVEGFVSPDDGSVSLRNILIPMAAEPAAQPAVQAAVRLTSRLESNGGLFTLLHVGDEEAMPAVLCPDVPGWRWSKVTKQGDVIDRICETARETDADLIVMTTEGRHGFLDALRGSHSERVLRRSPCPLLVIPAGGFLASVLQAEAAGGAVQ
ncbi:MAG: universal stress protein [Nitrospiraceae bacterium]